jgi:hypothetical protein
MELEDVKCSAIGPPVQKKAPGGARRSQTPAGGALLDISYYDCVCIRSNYSTFISTIVNLPRILCYVNADTL